MRTELEVRLELERKISEIATKYCVEDQSIDPTNQTPLRGLNEHLSEIDKLARQVEDFALD